MNSMHVEDRASFTSTTRWIDEVRAERGLDRSSNSGKGNVNSISDSGVLIVLVGNKSDVSPEKRAVSTEEADAKAKDMGVMFMETSAKAGFNIKSLFRKIASSLPGIENANTMAPREDLVDVKLSSATENASVSATSCNC